MTNPFPIISKQSTATPIHLVTSKQYKAWLKARPTAWQAWLKANKFEAINGKYSIIPDSKGHISAVVCIISEAPDLWALSHLAENLPAQTYKLHGKIKQADATQLALGWALASYAYTRYKKPAVKTARLIAPKGCDIDYVKAMSEAIFWARDLVNAPPNDMNTAALAAEASKWAKAAGGKVKIIKGKELLKENYPLVYAVGKASESPPHLVDIRFTRKNAPKVTLVGKGVCFDSGGLDIKPSAFMRLMKKDMGGAAATLALAYALVATDMPVDLRVLLPIVENSVSDNAMRPSDIIKSRSGITVEVGNTDAEGRLILCDALYEADKEKPDLLIDCATLTGAARVALGADIPAFFTPDDTLAAKAAKSAEKTHDLIWRLPLYKPYRPFMDSATAELSNDSASRYGGAITAALYLQEFVTKTSSWMHVDMMAWNMTSRPGRPEGGEAMGVRTLYELIKERYGK